MRTGLLRALDVPEFIEGHVGVNVREQVLLLGAELMRHREQKEPADYHRFNPYLNVLTPETLDVSLKYYDQITQVYQTVLAMIDEMVSMGDVKKPEVVELKQRVGGYVRRAGLLKTEFARRRGIRIGIPTLEELSKQPRGNI